MKQQGKPLSVLVAALLCLSARVNAQPNCQNTSVGFKPLTELGTGLHHGYSGGLYPNGSNVPPAGHDSAGRAIAAYIGPLDALGIPDPANGKVVLLSIGMSNATQEFSLFKLLADADPAKNPQLVIVDGAQGGQTASIIADPNANFWTIVEQRLASAGVTRQQVQVAWVKEANANPTQPFPTHALALRANYESIARNLKSKYPNIRIAYYSSRIYGGYASISLNPEPYAYESGFAVKWLIEKQIGGDSSLAYSGPNARAPWLAWGPYLWADGLTPRASDGLTWECSDFAQDGTHPAAGGRQKVANLLLTFFKTEPTATVWFLHPSTTWGAPTHNIPEQFVLEQNYPNPFNPSTTIRFSLPQTERVVLKVCDALGREVATLLNGELQPGTFDVQWNAGGLPSGLYVYRLHAGSFSAARTLLLLR